MVTWCFCPTRAAQPATVRLLQSNLGRLGQQGLPGRSSHGGITRSRKASSIRKSLATALVLRASPPISSSVRPTRFKAASPGRGRRIHQHVWPDQYQKTISPNLGYPWENKALWTKTAPFYRVKKSITTPALSWEGAWIGRAVLGGQNKCIKH